MMSVADMLAEFGVQVPERTPRRYIIGLPGWRFCIGYDVATDECCTVQWAWRCRENWSHGEMRYHFYFRLRFGRTMTRVIDLGGPSWFPRFIRRWGYQQRFAVPSSRWTGLQYEVVGIDWPRLEFNLFKIPEDAYARR